MSNTNPISNEEFGFIYLSNWRLYKAKPCMTVEVSEKYGPIIRFKCSVIFENLTTYRLIGCDQDKTDIYKSNITYFRVLEKEK